MTRNSIEELIKSWRSRYHSADRKGRWCGEKVVPPGALSFGRESGKIISGENMQRKVPLLLLCAFSQTAPNLLLA